MDREGRLPKKLLEFIYSECGESCERTAELLDSNKSTVYIMLKKYGIKRRGPGGIHYDKIHAIRLLSEHGWSIRTIRRVVGLSADFISRIRQEDEEG